MLTRVNRSLVPRSEACHNRRHQIEETELQIKRTGLLVQHFYFFMSLLIASVVVYGFAQRVDQQLFHPSHSKPLLLSVHAVVFSAWVVFYSVQSALVRTRNARVHRLLGWFGVARHCHPRDRHRHCDHHAALRLTIFRFGPSRTTTPHRSAGYNVVHRAFCLGRLLARKARVAPTSHADRQLRAYRRCLRSFPRAVSSLALVLHGR